MKIEVDLQYIISKQSFMLTKLLKDLDAKPSCRVATTANLSATYSNGSTVGVGATLTASSNGAITLDGVSPVVNDRILVKDQSTVAENGIYIVTNKVMVQLLLF